VQYPIHLLCPSDHALATAKGLTVKLIAQHPLVLSSEDTSDRAQVDATFANAGLLGQLNIAISATRLLLITRYIAVGFGVALLAPGKAKLPRPKTRRVRAHQPRC